MEQDRKLKTAGQVFDEINGMRDGDIMEIYKVREGFVTKFQAGWTSPLVVGQSEQCNHIFERVEKGGEFQGNQCDCGEWEDLT